MDYEEIIALILLLFYYSFRYIKDTKVRSITLGVICTFTLVSFAFLLNPEKNVYIYNFLTSDYIKFIDIILLILIFILPSPKKMKEKSS